ncbi:8-oxoguanine DNA glycosylase OGG fold protein [Ornithinicoccus halotolerans]|uniref:8-oxoguanine DNA glycosylase OGG fold protein n=1 Tax=Ornithinicoccus halotolerans TaxID=1748220 RepID=UPI001295C2EC|nr:hypothetical protein [Ornithinicoccus halotolerans]
MSQSPSVNLPVPPDLVTALASTSRHAHVHEHWVPVDPRWWDSRLTEHGLPGGPLQTPAGRDGRPGITRGQLFALAEDTATGDTEAVLRLLWHVLAWGTGSGYRNQRARVGAVAALGSVEAATRLHGAGKLAATDPVAAYQSMKPRGDHRIRELGPAFFTKYLYFAGAGDAEHRAVIMDTVVATVLRDRYRWTTLSTLPQWRASTYRSYVELVDRWAREAAQRIGRRVSPDEVEVWLYRQ